MFSPNEPNCTWIEFFFFNLMEKMIKNPNLATNALDVSSSSKAWTHLFGLLRSDHSKSICSLFLLTFFGIIFSFRIIRNDDSLAKIAFKLIQSKHMTVIHFMFCSFLRRLACFTVFNNKQTRGSKSKLFTKLCLKFYDWIYKEINVKATI